MKKALLLTLPLVLLCLAQAMASGSSLVAGAGPDGRPAYWGAEEIPTPIVDWPINVVEGKPDQNTILQGGDNLTNAYPITSLPFNDDGTTVGYTNNWEPPCSGTFGGPDVVYSFTPPYDMTVNIHLCPSSFYAVLYVYVNDTTTVAGCSGFSLICQPGPPSGALDLLNLTAGNVYYIVVDGYYTSEGTYSIQVFEPPHVTCPPGGIAEGETDCGPEYVDNFNGGCNSTPPVFGSISIGDTVCGASGIFTSGGGTYRDTDWFTFTVEEQQVITWTAVAEFPLQLFMFYAADCTQLTDLNAGYGVAGDTVSISANVVPGTYYAFVSPSVYDPVFACPVNYVAWLTASASQPAPANDNCADVTPVPLVPGTPLVFTGDNTWATMDCTNLGMPESWVAFSLDVTANVYLTYCGTAPSFNSCFIVINDMCPCGGHINFSMYNQWECGDNNFTIRWDNLAPGTYYYPVMSKWGIASGPYNINVTAVGFPEMEVSPTEISGETTPGNSVTNTVTIENTGFADLNYELAIIQNPNALSFDGAAPEHAYFGGLKSAAPAKTEPVGESQPGGDFALQGGEDITTATPIDFLPYNDNGNTGSSIDDYPGPCGNPGGYDVVYSFSPGAPITVDVSLCGSSFDTQLYIFANDPANVVACNDDYCGGQSRLPEIDLAPGNIYYIVVDGYSGSSYGDYQLSVIEVIPCILTCPPGAIAELELCGDNFNGGCDADPHVFEAIAGNVTVCGTAWSDGSLRDTDWYEFICSAPTYLTVSGVAEFPMQMGLFNAASGCPVGVPMRAFVSAPCTTTTTVATLLPGTYWIYVSTYQWPGVPCDGTGEFGTDYQLTTHSDPAWLYTDIVSGTISPASAPVPVTVTMDASQIGAGNYTGTIFVSSNGRNNALTEVAATFTVTSAGCQYISGDINNNGSANGIDVVYGVNYFKGSSAPPVDCGGICPQASPFYAAGDVNGNCGFNGIDVTFFVNYLKGVVPALLSCPTCPPAGTVAGAGIVKTVVNPLKASSTSGAE